MLGAAKFFVQLVKHGRQFPEQGINLRLDGAQQVALASITRGNLTAAVHLLRAFQHQVRAQVAPVDPALAEQLIQTAQQVIEALICASSERPHPRVDKIVRRRGGNVHVHITAPAGQQCLVEASTNLVDWVVLGPATELGDCNFVFEDDQAAGAPARFYRVVTRQ